MRTVLLLILLMGSIVLLASGCMKTSTPPQPPGTSVADRAATNSLPPSTSEATPAAHQGKVSEIYRPGPQVAQEASLVDQPNWVAKIVEHSPDWRQVTVWIGPPESEYCEELKLKWADNLDCYQVASHRALPFQ